MRLRLCDFATWRRFDAIMIDASARQVTSGRTENEKTRTHLIDRAQHFGHQSSASLKHAQPLDSVIKRLLADKTLGRRRRRRRRRRDQNGPNDAQVCRRQAKHSTAIQLRTMTLLTSVQLQRQTQLQRKVVAPSDYNDSDSQPSLSRRVQ